MAAENVNSTQQLRYRPNCRICREVPLSRSIVSTDARRFYKEHWRQYKIGQQSVTSEDLNSDWSDTRDNWRERPPELDEEHQRLFRQTG
jgi:hypothetical protein